MSQDKPGFSQFPGMETCCDGYGDAAGTGLWLSFETGLRYSIIDLNVGIGFGTNSNSFYGETTEPVRLPSNEETTAVFSHNLDAERQLIAPYASLGINPLWDFRLYGGMGMTSHISTSYDYFEKIESPSTGTFEPEGTRIRAQQNGEINDIANPFYYFAGISYELPMSENGGLNLVPFLEYGGNLSTLLTDSIWDHSFLRAGIGLSYNYDIVLGSDTYTPAYNTIIKIDTVISSGPGVQQSKAGKFSIGEQSTSLSIDTLQISSREYEVSYLTTISRTDTLYRPTDLAIQLELQPDFFSIPLEIYTEAIPVLPYIFFKENSTQLYSPQSNQSDWESALNTQSSRQSYLYSNTLNLIAQRLTNSNANITLIGYIDPTTENRCQLGNMRAETVKGLLTERGVNPQRITIAKARRSDCAPPSRTQTDTLPAYEENRRVEITSDDPSLFASYLIKSQPRVMAVSKDNIRLNYSVLSADSNSEFSDLQPGDIKAVSGKGLLNGKSFSVGNSDRILTPNGDFDVEVNKSDDNQVFLNAKGKNHKVELGVEEATFEINALTSAGETITDKKNLWIRYDTSAVSKSRLSIVLFPVGKSQLTQFGKDEIKRYAERLDKGEELSVIGYADDIGDEDNNDKLARERAEKVIEYLRTIRPDLKAYLTETDGKPVGINSFDTPQERLLSRTVQIEADIRLTKERM